MMTPGAGVCSDGIMRRRRRREGGKGEEEKEEEEEDNEIRRGYISVERLLKYIPTKQRNICLTGCRQNN